MSSTGKYIPPHKRKNIIKKNINKTTNNKTNINERISF